jgi:hypothetical protein
MTGDKGARRKISDRAADKILKAGTLFALDIVRSSGLLS